MLNALSQNSSIFMECCEANDHHYHMTTIPHNHHYHTTTIPYNAQRFQSNTITPWTHRMVIILLPSSCKLPYSKRH